MDAVVIEPAPASPATSKFVVKVVDEREVLRETPNVLWKSARLRGKETGLWSRYPSGGESHVVRVEDTWHLPAYGAVVDKQGQLFSHSVSGVGYPGLRLEDMPDFRSKRDRLMFYPANDIPRIEAASLFCNWPGQFNYAHFLLESMTALAVLDDIDALERYAPIAPPLDAWRRDLVELFLGERAGLLREVDAPIVRLGQAVYSNAMGGLRHAPATALMLLRERLLSQAIAVGPRPKASRRIYFARSDVRRTSGHKRLFAALREQGFLIVDPVKLSPVEQILLVSRAKLIVGPTGAAMANVLFAPIGTQVIEIQSGPRATGWVWRLCRDLGMRWSEYACPPPQDDTPLSSVYTDVVYEENIVVEELMAVANAQAEG